MYHAHLACVESYVDDGKIRNRTFGSCRRNYERLIAPPVGRKKILIIVSIPLLYKLTMMF